MNLPAEVLLADRKDLLKEFKRCLYEQWMSLQPPTKLIINNPTLFRKVIESNEYSPSDGRYWGLILLVCDGGGDRVE